MTYSFRHTVESATSVPFGLKFFTFIIGSPLKRGEITLKTIIWDLTMLTFIDGEPLKARLLLRGSTVHSQDASLLGRAC